MKVLENYSYTRACLLVFLLVFLSSFPVYLNAANWQKIRFLDFAFPVMFSRISPEFLPIYKHLDTEYLPIGDTLTWESTTQEVLSEVAQEHVAREIFLTRAELVTLRDIIYPTVTRLTILPSNDVPFDQNLVEITNRIFPEIEELVLAGNRLNDTEFALLAQSPLSFRIRVLDVSLNALTAHSIAHLASFTQLQALNLSTNIYLGDTGLYDLASITFLSEQLRVLNLESTGITPQGLSYLSDFTALRSLVLASNNVGDRGLVHITQACFAPMLESLDLNDTGITAYGIRELVSCSFAQLQELYLNENNDTLDSSHLEWLSFLARAPFAQNLRVLMLSNANLLRSDIETLRTSFPRLTVLNIAGNNLTAADLTILSEASFATNLHALNVNNNPIQRQGNGIGIIALYFTRLRRLHASRTGLVNSDIAVLTTAPLAAYLQVLDISHNAAIADEAFRYLAVMRAFPSLASLNISYTGITRNALVFLVYCSFSACLQELWVWGTINQADLELILAHFPNLKKMPIFA